MASGSNNLTTYYAKRIIGDTNAQTSATALLQTGTGIATDLWILGNTVHDTYGIRYLYDGDNSHDKLQSWGGGNAATAWVQLDTGDVYILGKVGIGYDPNTSGNTYKLYVNGTGYFSNSLITASGLHAAFIELSYTTPYIDFHFDNSTADNTSRIIETSAGYLQIPGSFGVGGQNTSYKFYVNGTSYFSDNVTIASGKRIGGSGGSLYIGNSGNESWVYVQDIASQTSTDNWKITQAGVGSFKNAHITDGLLYIKKTTTDWKTGAKLEFNTTMSSTTGYSYIASYQTPTATTYNDSLVIVATGGCFIGGGEGAETIHQAVMTGTGTEDLYLCPDGAIRIYTGADNKTQRAIFDSSSQFYPATNNTGAIGTSGNKWANMYATTFHGALDGNANTATALTSNAGGTEQPIYFTGGKPSATSYALKATVNNSTAGYFAYYSGARAISGTSNARLTDGCLNLYPSSGSYREGIRIYPVSSWSTIVLGGNNLSATSGTSTDSWSIHNNNGNFYISRNGSSTGTSLFGCVSNIWRLYTSADMPQGAANIASACADAHYMTFYRNAILIPYQMDNTNDGGFFRVRGTSESTCIAEIGTWDDSGAGETIEFNYYPTTSQITPTYSIAVPKETGTIFLRRPWWTSGNGNNSNDLRHGCVFAYTNHNCPTNGTLVAFDCSTNENYTLQLQGNYGGSGLFYRNRNGDNGTWGSWYQVVHNSGTWSISITGNAGSATYLKDKTNGTASYLNYGRSGITSASSYTWVCAWDGYNVVPVSKGSIYESVRDGGGDSRWYVKSADNNHITHTNEFNFVGSGYSGTVYFNYRTSGGGNGSISQYIFSTGNGSSTSRAGISCGSLGCSSLSCSSITGTSATLHIYNGNGARLSLQSDNNLVWYRKDGSVVWSSGTSSYRTKQNIRSIDEYELSNFMKIRTVSFKYRPEMHFADTDKQYGVIAEELLSSYPNLVYIPEEYVDSKFDVKKGMEQPLIRVKYEQFIPLLIKMVQKQQKEIEELRKQIKCD